MAFFPADRAVPETLRTPTFVLRPLRVAEAGRDYAAYMSSPEVIRVHSGGHWPVAGFTLADGEPHHHARWHRTPGNGALVYESPGMERSRRRAQSWCTFLPDWRILI
jgi:hypothetical protein